MCDQDLARILRALEQAEAHENTIWKTVAECGAEPKIVFFIECTGWFDPHARELEPVTADTVALLEQATAAVKAAAAGDATFAPHLYAAWRRRTKLMQSAYPPDSRLWPLLDTVESFGEPAGEAEPAGVA